MPYETLDKIVRIVRVSATWAKAKYLLLVPDAMYTVFHKIETPLYFGNNFFKC